MNKRRALYAALSFLALFLLGTVVVLSSVTYYLHINPAAYITEHELPVLDNTTRWNGPAHGQVEHIPRIIHQTWKTETLPQRWRAISQECRDMMPDYEYMLWTDEGSRVFIAEHYPWFLETFENYVYPIQRADAIRYFVLYHYGGVYIDLDIGCLKPLDPLLVYPVIFPKTIPVGVSNDLMFSAKNHPMLNQTIHNIQKFDHSWILNYPTVMFSTGPMFLSAQYGLYTSAHPDTALQDVRILPKSLYGKNAKENEAPHSFFSHFYGSSWHADDAAFIGFLATWGKLLMWIGLVVLIIGIIRMPSKSGRRFTRGYEIIFPRISRSRSGRWHIHLGRPSYSSLPNGLPPSPTSTEASSPLDVEVPVIHLPFDSPSSPSTDEYDYSESDLYAGRTQSPLVEAFRRVRNRVSSMAGTYQYQEPPETPIRTGSRRYTRGVMFLLPAIFAPTADIELQPAPPPRNTRSNTRSTLPLHADRTTPHVPEKHNLRERDIENRGDQGQSSQHQDAEHTPFSSLIDLHDPPSRTRTPVNRPSSRASSS